MSEVCGSAQEINRLTLQPEAGMWMTFTHRARG